MKFQINKEQIQQYFHLPLEEAAIKLGCCSSVLKRTCRQLGIKRWPYRRMKSLSKRQTQLQQQLTTLHDQYMKSRKQLEDVEGEMDVIIKEELSGIAEGATVIIDDANILIDDEDGGVLVEDNNNTTTNITANNMFEPIPSSSSSNHNNISSYQPQQQHLPNSLSSSPNNHHHHQQTTSSYVGSSSQHVVNNNTMYNNSMEINSANIQNNNIHNRTITCINGDPNFMMHVSSSSNQSSSHQHVNSNVSMNDTFDAQQHHAFGNVNNNAHFMNQSHVNQHQQQSTHPMDSNHLNNNATPSNSGNGWNTEKSMHATPIWPNNSELDTSQYGQIINLDNEHSQDASVHESINTADYTTRGRGGFSFPSNRHGSSGRSPNYAMHHVEPCFRPLISTLDGVNVNAALTNDRGLLMWFSKGLQETLPSYFNTQAVNKDYKKDVTFKGSTVDVYESFYRRRATHGTIRMIQCFFDRYVVVDCHGVMLNHYSAHPSAGSHYMWYLHVRKETDFSLISSFFNPSERNKALQFGVAYTFQLEDENK